MFGFDENKNGVEHKLVSWKSIYEKINEEGYLFVNWYDDEVQLRGMMKRDCLYNRDWQESQESLYVLK